MQKYSYTVELNSCKKRLDHFLSEQNLPLTRSQIKRLIDNQLVTINHLSAKPSCRVKKGDLIELDLHEPKEPTVEPENIPIDILYEDDSIVVVNKRSGMVVHPAAGNHSGTLVNALLFHCSFLSGVGGVMRPGIVHRLDKGTSGVLVVAKNDNAHQSLSRQFKNRKVKKIYRALVRGQMEAEKGTVDAEIGRHREDRKKMSTRTKKGRVALTHWKVLKRYNELCLLEIEIKTGRTHQIRVHLSSSHHPIVGDSVYGSKKGMSRIKNDMLIKRLNSLSRPFLHAYLLGIHHPDDNSYQEFIAPLPGELNEILTLFGSEKC